MSVLLRGVSVVLSCLLAAWLSMSGVEARQAATSIVGVVVDQSGAAIAGATVTLVEQDAVRATTMTATNGEFSLGPVAAGRYVIVVEQALFEAARITLEVAAGSAVPAQRFTLKVPTQREQVSVIAPANRPLLLDATTETGSRLNLTNRETPASVEVLSEARLTEVGATNTREALNRAAGVRAQSDSANGAGAPVLRGFSAGNAVLYDGTRVASPPFQSRVQDSWTFDRVEVLRGPASVLYGEGALTGVVNFVPKRPRLGEHGYSALVGLGSRDFRRLAGDVNLPIGQRAAARAVVSYSQSAGFVDDTESEFFGASLGMQVRPTDQLTLDLSVDYSYDDYAAPYYGAPLVSAAVAREPSDLVQTNTGLVVDRSLRHRNYTLEDSTFGGDTRWYRTRLSYRPHQAVRITNDFTIYDADHRFLDAFAFTFNASTQLLARTSRLRFNELLFVVERPVITVDAPVLGRRNRLSVGAEVSDLNYLSRRGDGTLAPIDPYNPVRGRVPQDHDTARFFTTRIGEDTTVRTKAAFIEDAFNLTPRWLFAGGVRYESIAVDRESTNRNSGAVSAFAVAFDPVSWKLGSVFDVRPRTQLFAQHSSAVVPVASIPLLSLANSRFKLTTGQASEAGLKSTLFGERVDLTVSAYRITQDDIITRDPNDPTLSVQGGSQSSRGVEASASVEVTRALRLDGSYSVLRARFDELIEAGGLNRKGNTPLGVPETIANLFAVYRFDSTPVTLTGTLRHEGTVFLNNANTIRLSGYTTLDASVGYRFRAGDLTLRGRNLTDEFYADAASLATQVFLAAPRSLDLTFTARF